MKHPGAAMKTMGVLLILGALGLTGYNLLDARRADEAAQSVVAQLEEMVPGRTVRSAKGAAGETVILAAGSPAEVPTAETDETPGHSKSVKNGRGTTKAGKVGLEGTPEEADPFEDVLDREMPTMEVGGNSYIGILDIPDLKLSLPVMEDWSYDKLQISPCRFSGSIYRNDLVICAHNYPMHFRPVKSLPLGAELTFTDAEGNVTAYRIFDIETIGKDDVEGMTTGDWDLTLFTCTLEGQARAAIRCERI